MTMTATMPVREKINGEAGQLKWTDPIEAIDITEIRTLGGYADLQALLRFQRDQFRLGFLNQKGIKVTTSEGEYIVLCKDQENMKENLLAFLTSTLRRAATMQGITVPNTIETLVSERVNLREGDFRQPGFLVETAETILDEDCAKEPVRKVWCLMMTSQIAELAPTVLGTELTTETTWEAVKEEFKVGLVPNVEDNLVALLVRFREIKTSRANGKGRRDRRRKPETKADGISGGYRPMTTGR